MISANRTFGSHSFFSGKVGPSEIPGFHTQVFYDLQRQLKLQLPGIQILAVPQSVEEEFLGKELFLVFFLFNLILNSANG